MNAPTTIERPLEIIGRQTPFHPYVYQVQAAPLLAFSPVFMLADEMGVGKTVTGVLAADLANCRSVVVVVRAAGIPVWVQHFTEWQTRQRIVGEWPLKRNAPAPDVLVVSLAVVGRDEVQQQIVDMFGGHFDALIFDECHDGKNPKAQRTKGVCRLAHFAGREWWLTGTPMPNKNPAEMYVFASRLRQRGMTGTWPGSYYQFQRLYCTGFATERGFKVMGARNQSDMTARISPWYLRRLDKDVAAHRPPLRILQHPLEVAVLDEMRDLIDDPLVIMALRMMMEGRRPPEAARGKVSTLRRLTEVAKVPAAVALAHSEMAELDGGHKRVLMFSHTEALLNADKLLRDLGYSPVIVNGSVNRKNRKARVDAFQNDPAVGPFLGNIQAAGVAVTLTAADYMDIIGASWVPDDNTQAIKRIHREGQTKPCTARFLYAANTPDDLVSSTLRRKLAIKLGLE